MEKSKCHGADVLPVIGTDFYICNDCNERCDITTTMEPKTDNKQLSAHNYLHDKGIRSIGDKRIAYDIEKYMEEYTQQQTQALVDKIGSQATYIETLESEVQFHCVEKDKLQNQIKSLSGVIDSQKLTNDALVKDLAGLKAGYQVKCNDVKVEEEKYNELKEVADEMAKALKLWHEISIIGMDNCSDGRFSEAYTAADESLEAHEQLNKK